MLNLSKASQIIEAAFAKAADLQLKPIVVAVYNAGGTLIAYQAQDGASSGRFAIAGGKARGALAIGTGSRWLNDQAAERPHFLAGLGSVIEGGVVPVPGGVLGRDEDGALIAAVGISGDTSDNDEACAVAGLEAVGLSAETG